LTLAPVLESTKNCPSRAYYYVLTYASPAQQSDGRYHTIRLEISRPGLVLSYRQGYYSPREQLTFERRKKEDILEALREPGNLNEIPISCPYNYYQLDDSHYEVALLAQVGIRRVRFLGEDSRHKNLISLVVAVFDETDRYVDGLERSVGFNLGESSYSSLLAHDFAIKVELRLPLGRYKVKVVVREGVQGKNVPVLAFYKMYNLSGNPGEWKLVAKVRLVRELGEAQVFPPFPLDQSISLTSKTEVSIGIRLPFDRVAPGKYKLVIETFETTSNQSVTVQIDLRFQ
jgi:hypothetical protein